MARPDSPTATTVAYEVWVRWDGGSMQIDAHDRLDREQAFARARHYTADEIETAAMEGREVEVEHVVVKSITTRTIVEKEA